MDILDDTQFENLLKRIEYLDTKHPDIDISQYVNDFITPENYRSLGVCENIVGDIERIMAKCLASNDYAKGLLDSRYVSYSKQELYNHVYLAFIIPFFNKTLTPMYLNIIDCFKSITVKNLFLHCVEKDYVDLNWLSEWELADILFQIDDKDAIWLISQIDTSNKQKSILKRIIFNRDKDAFVNYVLSECIITSDIHFAAYILWVTKFVNPGLHSAGDTIIQTIKETPSLILPRGFHNLITDFDNNEYNITPYQLERIFFTNVVRSLLLLKEIRHLCTDYEALNRIDEGLKFFEPLKDIYENYSVDTIKDSYEWAIVITVAEEFKHRFIKELNLPESIGAAKDQSEAYNGVKERKTHNGVKEHVNWTQDQIFYLYEQLVDAGYLAWDEAIAFAFMYRMCPEYKPQEKCDTPIVWNGNPSELWTMVSFFHPKNYKINKLTRSFFINVDGSTFKETQGGKNSSNVKKGMIPLILADPKFK